MARCRYSHQPSISRGWEYLKRICVPYTDIHTNVRFPVRASNELLVSDIVSTEKNFLISSQPLSTIKSAECFKRIKMSSLLRGTSEKTYEEQYTLRGRKMAGRSPGKLRAAVFEYDGRTVQRCFGDFLFMVRIFLYTKILRR